MANVLIVDDERGVRFTLAEFLKDDGHAVKTAVNAHEALDIVANQPIEIVVSDIILPRMSGMDFLIQARKNYPELLVILMTGEPKVETAAQALRAGAADYLAKPVSGDGIRKAVANAARVKALSDENRKLHEEVRRHRDQLKEVVDRRTKQLRGYSERVHHIAEKTKQLAIYTDIKELSSVILNIFASNMDCEGGSLYLNEKNSLRLMYSIEGEHQPELLEFPLPKGSAIGKAFELQNDLFIQDCSKEPHFTPSGWGNYKDQSLLVFLLQDGQGNILGLVNLHNKRNPPFKNQDLELGKIIAGHALASIINARLKCSLAESERRHRSLVENAPLGLISIDHDGRILDVNPALLDILGSPSAEATKSINFFTFPPLVEAGIADAVGRCLREGKPFVFETPYRSKWGKDTHLRITGTAIRGLDGNIVGMEAIVEDLNR